MALRVINIITTKDRKMQAIYKNIMDPKLNPLMLLPIAQRFQVMLLLSTMWTVIFTVSIGAWFLYGALWIGHVLVLSGVLVTSTIFQSTPKRQALTYRDFP